MRSKCRFAYPRTVIAAACLMGVCGSIAAQPPGFNYDESQVPQFTLPDPLVMVDGTAVSDAAMWTRQRRPELLELFRVHVYGRRPQQPVPLTFEELPADSEALGGIAIRQEIVIRFGERPDGPSMRMLVYRPKVQQPVPVFLGLNFQGNHSIEPDPGITLNRQAAELRAKRKLTEQELVQTRGVASSRWPVELIVGRGYALATIFYGDIDPDFDDDFRNGVHALFPRPEGESLPGDAWGSIATWAWGLSRAVDYLESSPVFDEKRIAVMGHSRLGKTSLWAGAEDERIALVISNNSGCGGAALSRRQFGETVARINTAFPHWFCDNFNMYSGNENALPVDQHELIALIAPRPVYVASAVDDQWADPRGEYLSLYDAVPVYRLLGTPGLSEFTREPPAVDMPRNSGRLGYHIRTGKHDVTTYDWQQYLDFADRQLKP